MNKIEIINLMKPENVLFFLESYVSAMLKEPTSFLSKPRLNVTISTRFSPHLIFCLGIKFTSPHVVKFQGSHGIEVSSLERQLRSLTAKFGPKRNREYIWVKKVKSRAPFLYLLWSAVAKSIGAI